MSIDIVDDLHCAEDRIGLLEHTLESLIRGITEGSPADYSLVLAQAQSVLAVGYCRPSCDHEDISEAWCGFCAARIHRTGHYVGDTGEYVDDGWAHDPPFGEHEEPIVVEYDDTCGCPCHNRQES